MRYQIEIDEMDAWFLHGFLSGYSERMKSAGNNKPAEIFERILKDMLKSMGDEPMQ